MKAARVFVQPSVREGFGMTVAEAQACGAVPVVVRSEASAAPDLVRDGVDGVVVDASASAISEAVSGLLGDPRRLRVDVDCRESHSRGSQLGPPCQPDGRVYLDALGGVAALAAAR